MSNSSLTATFLRERKTGTARIIYAVQGTAKAIADFIEHQGDNARFLQEDGTIGIDVTSVPVWYSKRDVGETCTLRFAPDIDTYVLEMTYHERRLRNIMREAHGIGDTQSPYMQPNPLVAQEDNDPEEGEEQQDANLSAPAQPVKKQRVRMR